MTAHDGSSAESTAGMACGYPDDASSESSSSYGQDVPANARACSSSCGRCRPSRVSLAQDTGSQRGIHLLAVLACPPRCFCRSGRSQINFSALLGLSEAIHSCSGASPDRAAFAPRMIAMTQERSVPPPNTRKALTRDLALPAWPGLSISVQPSADSSACCPVPLRLDSRHPGDAFTILDMG
jgi:hypothetical protein